MIQIKDKTYSNPGKYIIHATSICYAVSNTVNANDIVEVDIDLSDMHKISETLFACSNDKVIGYVGTDETYADVKTRLIHQRYSNDDQLALILNKDSGDNEDLLAYNNMQDWRTWCSTYAKALLACI